ncbi:MAG TPA: response regulator [Opitutaceae bacterium]
MNNPKHSILIVEDEPVDAELLERSFKQLGLMNPLHWVTNGEEAVRYIEGRGEFQDRAIHPFPRVIITDIKMPEMTGLELLRWMHANPKYRVVPVVVFTSSVRQSDVDEAFNYGASAYIAKPIGLAELNRAVKIIVDYWSLSLLPSISEQVQ